MTTNKDALAPRSLNTVIMPGSHDSGTYAIGCRSNFGPDVPWYGKLAPCIVANISKCQSLDIIGQLDAGVRFFDIRIASLNNEEYMIHGMYGAKISVAFAGIAQWISQHPEEIFILYVSFISTTPDLTLLTSLLGVGNIAPPSLSPISKIKDILASGKNVIIALDDNFSPKYNVWPLSWVSNTWPNKQDLPSLKAWCDSHLPSNPGTSVNVLQALLTPTFSTVIKGGIPKTLASEVDQVLGTWLDDWKQQNKSLNVIMIDFAGSDKIVISKIIGMNFG